MWTNTASDRLPEPGQLGMPAKFGEWREGQDDAILAGINSDKQYVAQVMPTGKGKTAVAMAQALINGGRVIYLTSTKGLQDQLLREFGPTGMVDIRGKSNYQCACNPELTCEEGGESHCIDRGTVMCPHSAAMYKAKSARHVTTNYACWLTNGDQFGHFDLMVCDECFPAGTLVDDRPIESIQVGDTVTSFNERIGELEERLVSKVFRSRPKGMVTVHLSDGSRISCTPGHPFWTMGGWAPATSLMGREVLRWDYVQHNSSSSPTNSVRSLWEMDESQPTGVEQPEAVVPPAGICVLLPPVLFPVSEDQSVPQQAHDRRQPNAKPCGAAENADDTKGAGMEPDSARGKWHGTYSATDITCQRVGLGDGGNDSYLCPPDLRNPYPLRPGYRRSDAPCGCGGRREQPQPSVTEGTGPSQGPVPRWVRVDRIEIHEPGSDGRFSGLCPDGFVYNLEVEETHTYLAEGVVVHNCHNLPAELSRAMSVQLSTHEVEDELGKSWPRQTDSISVWKDWARVLKRTAEIKRDVLAGDISKEKRSPASKLKRLTRLKNLVSKLTDLSSMAVGNWVVDQWEYGYQFDPIDPSKYGERMLFRGIKKVLLVSATITPKTIDMLGIKREDVDFQEYKSNFDPYRSPIVFIPTVFVDRNISPEGIRRLIERHDEILEGRLDRRGIVHTVSFKRRDWVLEQSQYASLCMTNYSKGEPTSMVVERYVQEEPPTFLVSPSVSTGYDFPGDACRFQILLKVPYPDLGSKVVKARAQLDKESGPYEAMQTLVQAAGRGMRAKDDWQEVFVIDNHASQFLFRYGHLAPKWFHVFFRTEQRVPRAPRLGRV